MTPDRALVYLVDDEPNNLDFYERALKGVCDLRRFTDASTMHTAAVSRRPDLVLLDQSMPGRNGSQALEALRQAGVDCGVVFVTAFPDDLEAKAAVAAQQALWIMAKPLRPSDLLAQVNMALSLTRMRQRRKSNASLGGK